MAENQYERVQREPSTAASIAAFLTPASLQVVAAVTYMLLEHRVGYRSSVYEGFAVFALGISPVVSMALFALLAPGLLPSERRRRALAATALGALSGLVLVVVLWYFAVPKD